ncbi:MAG: xanthine dehydrogenase family protein molybdopterin-binding subunit [Deltaproteobacteria bacterium]|nr:xanthine dehydrogenase family protein molybdopterin-binding subunit [Deltaproteobacteria bacterium]
MTAPEKRLPGSVAELPNSAPRYVGRPIDRVEDPALLTGRTQFIDDVVLPRMLHCAILRSPHAHARIASIDTREAEKLPGVVAVVTGEDAKRWSNPVMTVPPGWGTHCLATEKARFVGEPVAAVAAASRYVAEDALELIAVEYEPLPAVADARKALELGSPLVFEENGDNVMLRKLFTWGDIDGAFAGAVHVVQREFRWNRLGANPLETFGVVSQWDELAGTLTCRGSFQAQHHFAMARAMVFNLPLNRVRFISHPHGGSFGGKGGARGTDITALLSRKAGGRPVKWIEDRMEYLAGGASQAWDRHYDAALALDAGGKVLGFRVRLLDDLGATAEGWGAVSAAKPLTSFTGCYAIAAAQYDLTIVATNKLPGSPYRGMGPPPHNWVLEQLMDLAARELALDPAEIRRRNFIAPDAFPYTIASGNEYDSGDYAAALDAALAMGDYPALRAEQARLRAEGRYLGIGLVNTIEPGVFDWNAYAIVGQPGTGVPEGATVGIDLFGKLTIKVGFALEGQGQYTVAAQVLADWFTVDIADVRVIALDTLSAPPHFGPGGSRLGVALTGAVLGAAQRLTEKLVAVAAGLFRTPPEHVELRDGRIGVKGRPEASMPFQEVAQTMLARSDLLPPGVDPNPEATYVWTAPGRTPADDQGRAKSYLTAANACHLVLVEIDVETAQVHIKKYWIADDCGTRLNPANVEGQTQGGVAQGVGAALLEEAVYDEDGQLRTSTFMDYLLPTIYEVPMTEKRALCTPSPFTPLGAKGCGEGAMHTTPGAILCAINDALVPLGLELREVPASPQRLWTLLRQAKR